MSAFLSHSQPLVRRLSIALAFPVLISISLAQTAPKLVSPLARSAWVVHYKYDSPAQKSAPATYVNGKDAPKAAPTQVKSREYTLNDNVARSITRYTDGTTVTAYILNGISVRENPLETKDLIVEELSSAWMVESNFRRSYPGLDWVLPTHYKGIVEYKGNPCHFFQKALTSSAADNASRNDREDINVTMNSGPDRGAPTLFSPGDCEVWIAADGRPVTARVGGVTATFSHIPAEAVETITVPGRFTAKAKAFFDSLNPKAK